MLRTWTQPSIKLLSATQAALALHLDRSRIKVLCVQGRIKGAYKVGANWVIPQPIVRLPPPKRK